MIQQNFSVFIDQDGTRGFFATDQLKQSQILVTADDQKAVIPTNLLVLQKDGTYYLPLSLTELNNYSRQNTEPMSSDADNIQAVLPIIVEKIHIDKKWVETGRVRVNKLIREAEEVVTEALLKEEVDIEHIAINQMIDEPASTRYEGETLIIPLVEEILVVEKRYLLREEVRITKRQIETPMTQTVLLRKEEVVIERIDHQEVSPSEGS